MKKFLIQFLFFNLIACIFLIIFHFTLYRTIYNGLKIPGNITTFYVGNSTIESAINDKNLDNSLNFARYGEPINYTYAKIKSFVEVNPQIDTIIMSFDDTILFKEEVCYPQQNVLYFFNQFESDDWLTNLRTLSLNKNFESFAHLYDIGQIKPLILTLFNSESNYRQLGIGGYYKINEYKLKTDIERRKHNPDKIKSEEEWPLYNKHYMDKIVKFCDDKKIALILLTTPKHKEVWDQEAFKAIHNKYYQEVLLLDFTKYNLTDSCFRDCYHINQKGAEIFTQIVYDTIYKN